MYNILLGFDQCLWVNGKKNENNNKTSSIKFLISTVCTVYCVQLTMEYMYKSLVIDIVLKWTESGNPLCK